MMEFFKRKITKDQSRDTGMAMVLLLLLVISQMKREGTSIAAIVLQRLNMTVPQIYRPVAVVWLGFSDLLGAVVSKILLSIVFFARRDADWDFSPARGQGFLEAARFQGEQRIVMVERNHTFLSVRTSKDLTRVGGE